MFDWVLILIALGAGGAERMASGGNHTSMAEEIVAEVAKDAEPASESALLSGTDDEAAETAAQPAVLVAEDQTPTGKFLTATEVKPILDATKAQWAAVRPYDGNDLVYVTHLMAWRCGLHGINFSINDAPLQPWPVPPCNLESASPAAIPDDAQIYLRYELNSVQSLSIELIYDDLSTDIVRYERKQILIP